MVDLKETLRETSVPASAWRASVRDFILALVVFGTLFGAVGVDRGHAFPLPPPPELSAVADPAAVAAETKTPVAFKVQQPSMASDPLPERMPLFLIMAVAMASLVAFNTTIWRHLRRSYK